ncbi:MAG: DUF4129 domain-containing protein [Chloroflexia bacterium]
MALALLAVAALAAAAPEARAASSAAATPTALERAAYVRLLHSLLDQVNTAQAATGATRDDAVSLALRLLPDVITVGDAGGTLAHIDTAPLHDALAAHPPDLVGAQVYLAALLDLLDPGSVPRPTVGPSPTAEAGATPAPAFPPSLTPAYIPDGGAAGPPLGGGDAGQRFDRVLADPRFAQDGGNGVQQGLAGFFQPAIAYLLELPDVQRNLLVAVIAGLLVAFILFVNYRGAGRSRRRYWTAIVAGFFGSALVVFLLLTYLGAIFGLLGAVGWQALGALGVVVALGIGVFAAGNLRRARTAGGARPAVGFAAEAGWSATQAQAAAAAAATAGDYRKAVRYRYLATLLALDEAGQVRFDPSLTDGEYLRRVPSPLRAPFGPLVQLFERIWYGGYPATAHDYQEYQALAARAESAPPGPAQ